MAAYGSLSAWRAYAAERGNLAPTQAPGDVAGAALVRASDHIRYRYVANLLPDYDDTLDVIEFATYEAANLELATPGFFAKTYTPAQQKVLTQAGSIKWTVVGNGGATYGAQPVSTLIEAMLEPYVGDPDAPFPAVLVV